jgi:hypothetical protein
MTEQSNEAIQCNIHYAQTRDQLLQMAFWNFARFQGTLSLIAAQQTPSSPAVGPSPPQPWNYEYAYPNDCLQMRYIIPFCNTGFLDGVPISTQPNPNLSPVFNGPPVMFIVTSDNDQQGNQINAVCTNQFQAIGVYTRRISNVGLFSAAFVDAFAAALAAKIALALTGDKAMKKILLGAANQIIIQARVSDGNEGLTTQDITPDWLAARGYARDYVLPGYFIAPYGPLFPIS